MIWLRNVFLKYGLGAKRLSEIWFGCERVSEIWFGCETSSRTVKTGRNVFPIYGEGAKRLKRFSWPGLAYNYVHKGDLKSHSWHLSFDKWSSYRASLINIKITTVLSIIGK